MKSQQEFSIAIFSRLRPFLEGEETSDPILEIS